MIRRVREPLGTLELCERESGERWGGDAARDSRLVSLLRRFTQGPFRDRDLRALLDTRAAFAVAHRLDEGEVIEAVARLVRRGELTLRWGELPHLPSFGDEAEAEAVTPPPVAATEAITTWVEILLVEHDGSPVGGEPYRVIADDGRVIDGALDGRGFARVDGISPGACTVIFPKRDRTDWDGAELMIPEEPGEPPVRTWVEIELVEHDETPVKNEPFIVYDGDREVARGRLNDAGRARVTGEARGSWVVVFPFRHTTDVEAAG